MIPEVLGRFSKWFWNPNFWLPVNFTWEEIQPREDFRYPDNNDLLTYPILIATFLFFVRYCISNPYLFFPLANYYRLSLKRPPPPAKQKELEKLFATYNSKVPSAAVDRAATKLRWKASSVQKWLRQRKAAYSQAKGEKFADCGFMLQSHGFYCLLGFYVLMDKPWVWDISQCWNEYPHHQVDGDVWFYYMFGLGLYLSITLHQLLQPSRKDKLSMYMHHFFTLSLIGFSWTMNFVRVGTLVIFVHQCVDWLLLTTKLLIFLNKETLTNVFFATTFIVWIVSRLIFFPFWILRSAFFEGPTYMFMPSAYLFFALLVGLLLLNIMWLGLMIAVIYGKLKHGKLEDVRSSDEEEEELEGEEKEEEEEEEMRECESEGKRKKQ